MNKIMFFTVLSFSALQAMDSLPEFKAIDPNDTYPLQDGSHIRFSPNDFSGDTSPRHISIFSSESAPASIAGPPPRKKPLEIELVGASDDTITGIASYNDNIALCRQNGIGTLLTTRNQGGFMEIIITTHDELIACYFSNEHTIRFIGRDHIYEWNCKEGTLSNKGKAESSPAICRGLIATPISDEKKITHVIPHRRQQPMGCWKMLLWILFGRKPFR